MKQRFALLCTAIFCLAAAAASAGERSATIKVANMFCASCPYIVKATLARIDCVRDVSVSVAEKVATVTFDDAKCSAAQLAAAVTDAGFPATPKTR